LPTTITGAFLATLPFLGASFPSIIIALAMLVLGYLMLSTLRFPKVGLLMAPFPRQARWIVGCSVPVLYLTHPQWLLVLPVLYISVSLFWNVQIAARSEQRA